LYRCQFAVVHVGDGLTGNSRVSGDMQQTADGIPAPENHTSLPKQHQMY